MAESARERQGNARGWRGGVRTLATICLAGLLAACQIVPKSAGPTQQAPPEKPPETTIQPGLPTDTDRHRVALLVPQTGSNADVGMAIANLLK